jgi:hypothetical protein
MPKLRKNLSDLKIQEMRKQVIITLQNRIRDAFRRGDDEALGKAFNTLLQFNNSLPTHSEMGVESILSLLPEPLRSQTRVEVCHALGIDEHGDDWRPNDV